MAVSNTNTRKSKFMQHLRSVYPGSKYGVRVGDFDRLNGDVGASYRVMAGNQVVGLDLNRLDQAEAPVFWLGGFPTPVKTEPGGENRPIAASRLFGFNKDSDDPLKRSQQEVNDPLAARTISRFDFRQERLVDQDEDGWWEYLPTAPGRGDAMAPIVYFDYDAYMSAVHPRDCLGYPRLGEPHAERLRQAYGVAVPFAAYWDPAGKAPTRWQRPQSFQLVCGGMDGKLSSAEAGERVTLFPLGTTYRGPNFNGEPADYDDEELDNLTNLVHQTLGDARSEDPNFVEEPATGLQSLVGPLVAAIVMAVIAVFFIRMQMTSRPIGGRKKPNEPPDFSRVEGSEP